jgi:hypothetical protein
VTDYAMSEHAGPDWLAAAIGGGATAFAAILAWLGVRSNRPDPQDAVNDGFTGLLEQMRQELKAASRERSELRRLLDEERAEREEEREAWRAEREYFRGEIAQLQAVAEGFERLLRRNGIKLPPRRTLVSEDIKVVQATLHPLDSADD